MAAHFIVAPVMPYQATVQNGKNHTHSVRIFASIVVRWGSGSRRQAA